MELLVVGLNFRKTPVSLRERFSVAAERLGALLAELRASGDLQEAVVLSTCNRVEVYAVSERSSIRARRVFQSIANTIGSPAGEADLDEVESHHYLHRNEACVHHLFRVTSSLDSLVVGETEIVGQVKKAYQLAQAAGATGKILNRLFQKALSVSKEVRSRSGIGRCSTSVGAVALDVAEKIFGEDFARQTVLIVGAGKMGETTLRHLSKRGAKTILISNRSIDRARELAGQFNGQIVPFEEMPRALDRADLVISSTSAPHYVLTRNELEPAMKGRGHRPVLLIDLAVPRDIDPRVQELGGVYLYNIDQLAEIANQNLQRRQAEATACEELAMEQAREFAVRLFPEVRPNSGAESLHGLLPGAARFCPLARC